MRMMTGEELKQMRLSLNLSVAEVADMTFNTRQHIYMIERGKASKRNYIYLELFYEDYRRKVLFGG